MAGIYLHVPFCKQACHYCDFHFSTNTKTQETLVAAMSREIAMQANYLQGQELETIYFGGGTPLLLTHNELQLLLDSIYKHFGVAQRAEVTLEANPNDLNIGKLRDLQKAGINRLSIGIQSFDDSNLRYLHRAHNAPQAVNCVQQAQEIGIENISIDLIYAIPSSSDKSADSIWEQDLAQAIALKIPHISSYCLTIEPTTPFGNWLRKGKIQAIEEETAARHFETLISTLTTAGFEHYEISNFAQPHQYSRHNTNYWRQIPYLGIGPSAHSFNLESRQHNISNNTRYINAISNDTIPAEIEILSQYDRANEYILTSLRTQWGCNLAYLHQELGFDIATQYAKTLQQWSDNQLINKAGDFIKLSTKGKLLADRLASDLFVEKP